MRSHGEIEAAPDQRGLTTTKTNSVNDQPNLTAALSLAATGLPVFPAAPDKRPLLVGWQKKASSEPEQIRSWWRAHPDALPAIFVGGAGLLVIDCDRHPDGNDGIEAFNRLLSANGGSLADVPMTKTARGGAHLFFKQPKGKALGNRRGELPDGVDVRGAGGFVIAPGAVLPDGKAWQSVTGRPSLTDAFKANTIPELPLWLKGIIRPNRQPDREGIDEYSRPGTNSRLRGQAYAAAALQGAAAEVSTAPAGKRNEMLNAIAFRLGRMIARGWVDEKSVADALLGACDTNKYLREHGHRATMKTIESGIEAGKREPHPDPPDRDPSSGDDGTPVSKLSGLSDLSATRGAKPRTADSDLSDLSGLSAIRGAQQGRSGERQARGRTAETGTWEEPDWTLLDDRRGELPEFPVEALPTSIQDWLLRAARGAGVTPAHVAVPLLGVASSLIGTARRLRACRSWSEPLTMWVAVVGFSGTGKTPGLDVTRRVLSVIERSRKQKIAELQREHETRAQKAKAEKKKWEKAVADAVEAKLPAPPKPADATEPGLFVAPRLSLSDSTIERLAVLLEVRPQGMAFVADELARLFLNMKRYSNGQDNEFWLEAWDGKHFVVERQGRPPVVLDYLLVGVVGGLQPDKVARAFEGDEDGMYARFYFAWPEEPAHMPLSNEVSEIEPEIQNALMRIVDLPAGEDGVFAPRTVDLSPEGLSAFETFRTFLAQAKSDLDGREREWAAKGATHVLRLSGTLAYLDWAMQGGAEPQSIGEQYVEAAVQLWREYFWPHSRAALRQIGLTEKHNNARRALCWIRVNQKTEVSLLDIRREALGRRLDAEQTRTLLDGLVRAGWLKLVTTKTGGRDIHRWQVNPLLFSGASTSDRSSTVRAGARDISY
jgi:Protein of unknown function (DUF3987)/Bifunctional DNA primase/polymerase, N-terminal